MMARGAAKPKTTYVPADHGPPEPIARGDRVVEPPSDRGGARRAVNVNRLELTPSQEFAAEAIRTAYLAITAGLFPKTQNFDRIARGKTENWSNRIIHCVIQYNLWVLNCKDARTILDHVVDGHSCRSIDTGYRWRFGTAAEVIRAGLDLYGTLDRR